MQVQLQGTSPCTAVDIYKQSDKLQEANQSRGCCTGWTRLKWLYKHKGPDHADYLAPATDEAQQDKSDKCVGLLCV